MARNGVTAIYELLDYRHDHHVGVTAPSGAFRVTRWAGATRQATRSGSIGVRQGGTVAFSTLSNFGPP